MSAGKCFALWVNRNGQHLWAGPFTGNKAAQDYLGRLLDTSGGSLVTAGIPMTPPEAREAAPLLAVTEPVIPSPAKG
jgi:hypothetical protein